MHINQTRKLLVVGRAVKVNGQVYLVESGPELGKLTLVPIKLDPDRPSLELPDDLTQWTIEPY